MRGARGCVGGARSDDSDEIMKHRMQIARAFGRQRKENIGWIIMVLGIVRELGIVGALSGFGVPCMITMTWRGEDKVAKDRAVRLIKKRNKHIGALAGSNSSRCSRRSGTLTYGRGRGLSGIPGMNISGRLRNRVGFNKRNVVSREIFDNVAGGSTEAVTQRIV